MVAHHGSVSFGAASGGTNVVTVPLASHSEAPWSAFNVRGPGTVLFKNRDDNITLSGDWGGTGAVGLGGTFILDNSVLNNTSPSDVGHLFQGEYCTFRIMKGSILTYTWVHTSIGGANNTLHVTDPGSECNIYNARPLLGGYNNRLLIQDGAYMPVYDQFYYPNFFDGVDNLVRVSSSIPGKPAVLDLSFNNWFDGFLVFGTGNAFSLQTGGIVNCNVNFHLGLSYYDDYTARTPGNRVILEGGELNCKNFYVYDGNALAPVLRPGVDILPVVASVGAWFELGSKIAPTNPEKISGRFPIVKAPVIYMPPLDDPGFFEPPPGGDIKWELKITEDTDGQTLWLSCHHRRTLFLVK